MARRKAKVTAKNQNLTRLRLGRATTEAFDASRAKLRAAVMASEPGVYSAAQLWDDSWWVEAVDKFVAPVLWDAYMRSAFESLPKGTEVVPPWVFRSAEVSWRAQVNRVRHLGVTVGKRVAVLADTGEGETRGWMLDRLGLVAAAGPLSEGIEDGVVLTEGNAADQGGLSAGAELQQGFKTWIAAGANTRPTHSEADGQVVGFDELFVVGGEECEFPGDPALSDAEAINCQCETDYSMEEPVFVEVAEEWTLFNNYLEIEPLDFNKLYTLDEYVAWAERVGLPMPESVIAEGYDSVRKQITEELYKPAREAAEKLKLAGAEAKAAADVAVSQVTGELRKVSDLLDSQLRGSTSFSKMRKGRIVGSDVDVLTATRAGKVTRVQNAINEGLEAIDGVHGVPDGSRSLTFHSSSGKAQGSWNYGSVNGEAQQFIAIADSASNINTVLHEVGHYLDFEDLGTRPGTFGSGSFRVARSGTVRTAASEAMEPAMAALFETPEIKQMVSMLEELTLSPTRSLTIDGVTYGQNLGKSLQYLLDPQEVFARAYAQFIAIESGSAAVAADLSMLAANEQLAALVYKWSDESFATVMDAMRGLLRQAGVA